MTWQQRHDITVHLTDGWTAQQIHAALERNYPDNPLSLPSVYRWIQAIRAERTDLRNIPSPGRPPDEGIVPAVQLAFKEHPFASARSVAERLHLALGTVLRCLQEDLGTKYRHLRWVPHTLTEEHKAKRAELAGRMLEILSHHRESDFKFLFTGDESWMFYAYERTHQWDLSHGPVEKIQRKTNYQKKTMFTVFFNGTGDYFINVLPQGQTMNGQYFAEEVIKPLALLCYHGGRKAHGRHVEVHFDNAPIHRTKIVIEMLDKYEFVRMEHPPYSPDLAPCDFFLFGYIKEKLKGKSFAAQDDLFSAVREIMDGISKGQKLKVFTAWMERLQKCVDTAGEYCE
jgi:histone-lysine N-methyltransferase SETMAR